MRPALATAIVGVQASAISMRSRAAALREQKRTAKRPVTVQLVMAPSTQVAAALREG
jgi:hypothetical protein